MTRLADRLRKGVARRDQLPALERRVRSAEVAVTENRRLHEQLERHVEELETQLVECLEAAVARRRPRRPAAEAAAESLPGEGE